NHVRGLSPYPAAWSTLISDDTEQGAVKIFETAILPDMAPLTPGEIVIEGDTLTVGTATCPIRVLSLQAPGKRRVTTAEYLRGARLVTPRFKA
ncbi:MAG: methionyl-tRNA formyltransferase, partial [Duncaniella sp.]|nr:methionyl-tRNA formyltransferase [Duncaniella sp.]